MARWEWAGRWGGAACAVAGCVPMLAALAAGVTGAAGAEVAGAARAGAAATSGTMMMPVMGAAAVGTSGAAAAPGWVAALGDASWPLLIVAAGLLVWSFWRTSGAARVVAYTGVAALIVNQLHMRSWLFLPAMALVAGGFVLSYVGTHGLRGPRPSSPGRAPA